MKLLSSRITLIVIFTLFFLLFAIRDTHAYLDPGAGSMLVQIIVAGIAGFLMIFKLYWKRIIPRFKKLIKRVKKDSYE